jgi:DNA (cytosine-5)-methyltransferase 1
MTAYYNENDPKAAAWLRELIKQGLIATGVVDDRSIEDVKPDELREFTQCHFFAGIGVWSYALRQSGWSDDRPVWTGSCPCQPFSVAGKKGGTTDERHLWPVWYNLIRELRPPVVFGEQVASKAGLGWIDLVQANLEESNYASGANDLCAAGVGAPHIRSRLWFVGERVGDPVDARLEGHAGHGNGSREPGRVNAEPDRPVTSGGSASRVVDSSSNGNREHSGELHGDEGQHEERSPDGDNAPVDGSAVGRLAEAPSEPDGPGATNGLWRDSDWLFCRDGKWRPVEPGTFPLAHGAAARVGRLRGYGNAINSEVARVYIETFMEYQACK